VAKNVKLSADTIGDALDKLRGAVMIVYPMGLPPYDEVQQILDDNEQLEGRQAAKEIIPAGDMQVWWAGKELQRGKALQEYIGRNEKTKIVCKIQKVGLGRGWLGVSSGKSYVKDQTGGSERVVNKRGEETQTCKWGWLKPLPHRCDSTTNTRRLTPTRLPPFRSVEAAHLPVSRCTMKRRKRK
jgi:hypothetical protein